LTFSYKYSIIFIEDKERKEIYELKNELSCYKKLAGNIYIKKQAEKVFDF